MTELQNKLTTDDVERFFYEKNEAGEINGFVFEASINTEEYVVEENAHLYRLILKDVDNDEFYGTTVSVDEGDWTVWNLEPENFSPVVRVERVAYDYVEVEDNQ